MLENFAEQISQEQVRLRGILLEKQQEVAKIRLDYKRLSHVKNLLWGKTTKKIYSTGNRLKVARFALENGRIKPGTDAKHLGTSTSNIYRIVRDARWFKKLPDGGYALTEAGMAGLKEVA